MPQKNAFIIDQDRDFALMVAAALRSDGLKVSISEGDRDPLDEIKIERPDIVLMRAEAQNSESGFALCSRVKTNKRLGTLPVFLYTADANEQTIDNHRSGKSHADDYLILPDEPPYPLEELKERVKGVLFAPGVDRPPPLPPPPSKEPKPVTEEDSAFIEKVMDSLVSHEEEVPSTAPIRREGSMIGRRTTADAKLDMLRQKLRQRENELAKVMEMYRGKEREYHEWNERLVEKDVEAQSLRMTLDELSSTSESRREELDRRTAEFNASFEQLLEEKITRENELIQIVAGKERDIAELKVDLSRTERTLDDAKTRIEEIEKRVSDLDDNLSARDASLGDLEAQLEDAAGREKRLEDDNATRADAIQAATERHYELEEMILGLRSDLADAREALNEQVRNQGFELAASREVIDGLRHDVAMLRNNFAEERGGLESRLGELSAAFDQSTAAYEAESAKSSSLDESLEALRLSSSETESGLRADVDRLDTDLIRERHERADTERAFEERLTVASDRIDSLTSTESQLRSEVAARDGQIASLEQSLADEQAEGANKVEGLLGDVDRLESARLSTEQALADRETELGGAIASRDRTIEERDQVIGTLESNLADTRNELQGANDRGASLEAELADREERFEQLERKTSDEAAALQTDITRLHGELAESRDQAEVAETDLREQIIRLGTDLASRGNALDETKRLFEGEQRDRVQAEKAIAQLEQTLENTTTNLDDTTRSLRQTEKDLNQSRETLALRDGRLAEIQEALKNEQMEHEASQGALRDLNKEYDARGAEIGRLEGRVAGLAENLDSLKVESAELEEELERTRGDLGARQSELATARAEASERAQRLEQSAAMLSDRDRDIVGLRDNVAELSDARERLTAAREALTGERDRLNGELESLVTRRTELEGQLAAAKDRTDELSAEVDSRGGRIDLLERQVEAARTQASDLDAVRLELSQRLARAEEAVERTNGELERSREEWQAARQELVDEREALKERMREIGAELDQTRDNRDEVKSAKALFEEQANARAQMDAAEKSNLNERIEAIEAAAATREEELRMELAASVSRVADLDGQLDSVRHKLDAERQSMVAASTEIESLESRMADLADEKRQVETTGEGQRAALEGRLNELSTQFESSIAHSEQTRTDLEGELTEARNQYASIEAALAHEKDQAHQEGLRMQNEARALAERLEEATSRASAVASQKAAFEQTKAAELGAANDTIADLRRDVEARHGDLREANKQMDQLREHVERAQTDRDDVENKYVRELEDLHEEYMTKARDKDDQHAKEVEELRKAAIEAKRQLKTSQLAAQRLTDRIQKLETERPSKSDTEANFESLLQQISDSSLPVPAPAGESKRPAQRPRTGSLPPMAAKAKNGPSPETTVPDLEVPSTDLARQAAITNNKGVAQSDDEEDITHVGPNTPPKAASSSRPRPSPPPIGRRPKPEPVPEAAPTDEEADFLKLFEQEFQDNTEG